MTVILITLTSLTIITLKVLSIGKDYDETLKQEIHFK